MSGSHQAIFTEDTIITLSRRAMGMCGFPGCLHPTFGPDRNPEKYINVGIAVAIYVAKPGHARYKALPEAELTSADNAIWLCHTHAQLIDANDGANYTAGEIETWKKAHEDVMKEWLNGTKSVFFGLTLSDEYDTCLRFVAAIAGRAELSVPYPQPGAQTVVLSVRELNTFLTDLREDVSGTELERIIDATIKACIYLLDQVDLNSKEDRFPVIFSAFQKALGLSFAAIRQEYGVEIPGNIAGTISG